ncbi:MAG: response regulator [Magnetococcus sp. YQC-5]
MNNNYPPVLVVEPDDEFANLLTVQIERTLGCDVFRASSFVQTLQIVQSTLEKFLVALVEPHLPDAHSFEIVDHLLALSIPVILFSKTFDEGNREDILAKGVLDYVIKTGEYNLEYMVRLVDRIRKNRFIHVLIVDDSRSARAHFRYLLERRLFVVHDAPNGEIALQMLKEDDRIKMVLVDYQMTGMDGFQLIQQIRARFSEQELVIIGISAYGNNILSAKFIKHGANDFISKPFLIEEFHCRIDHCVNDLETYTALKHVYSRDFLTGLFSRLYLLEVGNKRLADAQKEDPLHSWFTIMVGVDQMREVNYEMNYDVGDTVIRAVARSIAGQFQDADMIARVGGAEFCVLMTRSGRDVINERLELLRKVMLKWSRSGRQNQRGTLPITLSYGVLDGHSTMMGDLLLQASALLYQAKSNGGNRTLWGVIERC